MLLFVILTFTTAFYGVFLLSKTFEYVVQRIHSCQVVLAEVFGDAGV
jgi:hypothetical protein